MASTRPQVRRTQDRRAAARRVVDATPTSVPAGLAALAMLTGRDGGGLPSAVTWAVLVLLALLVAGDLVTGGLSLAGRRRT